MTQSGDLWPQPSRPFRAEQDIEKVMAKVSSSSRVHTLKRQKNVLGKRKEDETEKKGCPPFVACHWFSRCEKHNRVKSVLKSGGRIPVASPPLFFLPLLQLKGGSLFLLCPQHPQWGRSSIHGVKTKQGKACDCEVGDVEYPFETQIVSLCMLASRAERFGTCTVKRRSNKKQNTIYLITRDHVVFTPFDGCFTALTSAFRTRWYLSHPEGS